MTSVCRQERARLLKLTENLLSSLHKFIAVKLSVVMAY